MRTLLSVSLFACLACAGFPVETDSVRMRTDGSFEPSNIQVAPGQTVSFELDRPRDGLVAMKPGTCEGLPVGKGPMGPKELPSGVHTLGPDDGRATRQETWEDPAVDGVFLRLQWSDIQPQADRFDFSGLDRELDRAVLAGKAVTLGVKAGKNGTPSWIFRNGVERLKFQDRGSSSSKTCKREPCCGFRMELGSPADPAYQQLYFAMLTELAEHIRSRSDWYRSLAMVKVSGANMLSHENRLPKRCEQGCTCNPEVWATARHPLTPHALNGFYEAQFELLDELFPDTMKSYMLIQAGFPKVTDRETYDRGEDAPGLPGGTEATERHIATGQRILGKKLMVQHNGLGPTRATCPGEGEHPKKPPFARASESCPNRWVLMAGVEGSATGFQTNNDRKVGDREALDGALRNLEQNSDAAFIEIYEDRAAEARGADGPLGRSGRSLSAWGSLLKSRNPSPTGFEHTFSDPGTFELASPRSCTVTGPRLTVHVSK